MRASVIAGCHGPPVLELREEVPPSGAGDIAPCHRHMMSYCRGWREYTVRYPFLTSLPERCLVITSVGDECVGRRQGIQDRACAFVAAHLTFTEHRGDRSALTIEYGGRSSCARA